MTSSPRPGLNAGDRGGTLAKLRSGSIFVTQGDEETKNVASTDIGGHESDAQFGLIAG